MGGEGQPSQESFVWLVGLGFLGVFFVWLVGFFFGGGALVLFVCLNRKPLKHSALTVL